jgi:hypothetical protein
MYFLSLYTCLSFNSHQKGKTRKEGKNFVEEKENQRQTVETEKDSKKTA